MAFKAFKVKCSRCGVEKFANENAYNARIKRYGSLEEVEKKWICNDCKKKEREQKAN